MSSYDSDISRGPHRLTVKRWHEQFWGHLPDERPMTQDEIDDAAADAFSDMCEGEPPISAAERHQIAAEQKRRLRS